MLRFFRFDVLCFRFWFPSTGAENAPGKVPKSHFCRDIINSFGIRTIAKKKKNRSFLPGKSIYKSKIMCTNKINSCVPVRIILRVVRRTLVVVIRNTRRPGFLKRADSRLNTRQSPQLCR